MQFPIKKIRLLSEFVKNHLWLFKSPHLRGLKFSRFSTADSASAVTTSNHCLWAHIATTDHLLFSFCPRSHALYGCAKYTCASSSAATFMFDKLATIVSCDGMDMCLVGFSMLIMVSATALAVLLGTY